MGGPRLVALISAIGASFFLQDGLRLFESLWRNTFYLNYPTLEFLDRNIPVSTALVIPVKSMLVIVTALLTLVGLHLFVNNTKLGTAIRAVAQDPDTASLMGVPVNRVIALTFFVGGAMGGLAGVLFGLHYSLVNPYSGFVPGMKAFTAAVLGGIGNIPGAMVGGMLLGLLEAFAASYLSLMTDGAFGAEYKDVVAFVVLILILIFRPRDCSARPCGRARHEPAAGGHRLVCLHRRELCARVFLSLSRCSPFCSSKHRCCCSTMPRSATKLKSFLARLVLLVLLPVLGTVNAYYLEIAMQIGIFVALALGLNIVVGFVGLLNLGFVAFYAIGAYLWAIFGSPHANQFIAGGLFPLSPNWFFVFLILSIVVGALTGALLGLPVLRLRGDYLAVVTLGFAEVVRALVNNLDKPINLTNGPRGITPIVKPPLFFKPLLEFFGLEIADAKLYPLYFYFLVLLLVFVHYPGYAPAGRLAHRAGLESDPRGRDRRGRHGRPGGAHEAARASPSALPSLPPWACCSPPSRCSSIRRASLSWNPSACSPW